MHDQKLQNIILSRSAYLIGVGVWHGLGAVDGLVEERIGEGGVVELVVAVAAVAHLFISQVCRIRIRIWVRFCQILPEIIGKSGQFA